MLVLWFTCLCLYYKSNIGVMSLNECFILLIFLYSSKLHLCIYFIFIVLAALIIHVVLVQSPPPVLLFSTTIFHYLQPVSPPASISLSLQILRGRCWQQLGLLSSLPCSFVMWLLCAEEDKGGQSRSITSAPSRLIGLRTRLRACSWVGWPGLFHMPLI